MCACQHSLYIYVCVHIYFLLPIQPRLPGSSCAGCLAGDASFAAAVGTVEAMSISSS